MPEFRTALNKWAPAPKKMAQFVFDRVTKPTELKKNKEGCPGADGK